MKCGVNLVALAAAALGKISLASDCVPSSQCKSTIPDANWHYVQSAGSSGYPSVWYYTPGAVNYNYEQAMDYCTSLGDTTNLAAILSQDEQTTAQSLYSKKMWVGGVTMASKSRWWWVEGPDNSKLWEWPSGAYSHWAEGEPNHLAHEDCLMINYWEQTKSTIGWWNDGKWDLEISVLCQCRCV